MVIIYNGTLLACSQCPHFPDCYVHEHRSCWTPIRTSVLSLRSLHLPPLFLHPKLPPNATAAMQWPASLRLPLPLLHFLAKITWQLYQPCISIQWHLHCAGQIKVQDFSLARNRRKSCSCTGHDAGATGHLQVTTRCLHQPQEERVLLIQTKKKRCLPGPASPTSMEIFFSWPTVSGMRPWSSIRLSQPPMARTFCGSTTLGWKGLPANMISTSSRSCPSISISSNTEWV